LTANDKFLLAGSERNVGSGPMGHGFDIAPPDLVQSVPAIQGDQ
jgi:hypothetical protein